MAAILKTPGANATQILATLDLSGPALLTPYAAYLTGSRNGGSNGYLTDFSGNSRHASADGAGPTVQPEYCSQPAAYTDGIQLPFTEAQLFAANTACTYLAFFRPGNKTSAGQLIGNYPWASNFWAGLVKTSSGNISAVSNGAIGQKNIARAIDSAYMTTWQFAGARFDANTTEVLTVNKATSDAVDVQSTATSGQTYSGGTSNLKVLSAYTSAMQGSGLDLAAVAMWPRKLTNTEFLSYCTMLQNLFKLRGLVYGQ